MDKNVGKDEKEKNKSPLSRVAKIPLSTNDKDFIFADFNKNEEK